MDPADGCGAAVNAAALAGNIALIDRGICDFSSKILNAKNAGAIGVIIVNNRTDDPATGAEGRLPIEMGVGVDGYQDLPAVMIMNADGAKIMSALPGDVIGSITPDNTPALGEFNGARGSADSLFSFIVSKAGVYPFRCIWYEGNGGANLEWFMVTTAGAKILVNDRPTDGALKSYRARTFAARPTMSLAKVGDVWKITYTGVLRSASTVNGDYQPVTGATSPYTVPVSSGTSMFYRASTN